MRSYDGSKLSLPKKSEIVLVDVEVEEGDGTRSLEGDMT